MQSVLLIGNGLNRLAEKGKKAESGGANLLKGLAPGQGKNYKNLSAWPLEFERIYAERNKNAQHMEIVSKYDLKKDIQESIEKLAITDDAWRLLQEFVKLPVKHILTTNYDYNLEKAFNPKFRREKSPDKTRERLFSLCRKIMPDGSQARVVWHIHGEIEGPESICLGYEHYCAQLAAMRELLTTPHKDFPGGPYLNRFLEPQEANGFDTPLSWLTLFFTHHIHIVGLSLSFLEIDLWWLLTYRLQYQLRHPALAPKNEIVYYHRPGPEAEKLRDELTLMRALGVTPRALGTGREDWESFYHLARKSIKAGAT